MVRHIYSPCLRNKIPKVTSLSLWTVTNTLFVRRLGYRHPGSHIPVSYPDGLNPISFPYATGVIISYGWGVALLISFLVSAVFHELCIAVPCHMFRLWAFIGIMFQVR
ncbi:hypothetical protein DKX38_028098 [Salix brachista]|uniref:diacylglycerol O-acyltransferase n=1 Tax=Salix brachista TaxID=2182728 RepID=A0A5N5J5W8_9ROSI|nr:hypothetical protein DKX38_028098 [Salix brachista]